MTEESAQEVYALQGGLEYLLFVEAGVEKGAC